MKYLAKLGSAVGIAIAFGVLGAPVADALPIGYPTGKPCTWNDRSYDHGELLTVRLPDGTYKWYRCSDGKWEEEKYGYSSSYPSSYTAYP